MAATNSTWFAQSWQTDNGLPNNNITGIAQTSDGFLWLGTPMGLVGFDGVQFRRFNFTDSIYEGNRGVMTMLRSRNGGLWLAMDRGAIIYLDGDKTKVFTQTNGLVNQETRQLAEAGDGTLWVFFFGGECRWIKNGQVMDLSASQNSPGRLLSALTSDAAGNIWWVEGGRLGVYRDEKFQRLARVGDCQLAAAKTNGIWVCSASRLFRCDTDGRMRDCGEFDPNHTSGGPTVLMEDSEGAVWIGTAFGGLFRYDGTNFESISTSRPEIQSLLEDREGNIWAGTLGGGLDRIRRRVVQLQGTESGLPFESVRSLCEDTNNTLWAVTENGKLASYSAAENKWQTISTGTNGDEYNFSCVTADSDGGLWIGTRSRRLLRFQNGQVAVVASDNLASSAILSLLSNTNGDLWIGEIGQDNLQCMRNGKLIKPALPASVHTLRALRAMAQDANGNIWFGSARGDLLRIQDDKVVEESQPSEDTVLSIRCLTPTPDGSLWIGYAGAGAGRIKDGHYRRFDTGQGLFDDYISQIVPDDNGWLWFGSDLGIFKVREKDFEELAEKKIQKLNPVHFGQGEGAANLQANFGYSPGGIRTRDGRLWIPTRAGLAVINPKLLPKNSKPAAVLLTRVIMDDQTIAQYKTVADSEPGNATLDLRTARPVLQLPPDYQRLEIDFTTLSFSDPENLQFRYRLVGLDSGWRETGTEDRFATYSRLPAGNYLFEVKARNSDGVWDENGLALSFTVLPYFWQTWWFRILSGFLLLAIVVGGVRYFETKRTQRQLARLEHERAIEQERARIAKDIHDDIGANLTEITLLSELAQSPDAPADEIRTDIHRIAAKARKLTNSLDEIVWAVNPRNDTLDSFVTYTCLYAEDFLKTAKIRCRLKVPEKIPNRTLATNVRHNLFLVVKEALNNIVKHASANEVNIAISLVENGFELVIKDNGRGFDPPGADKSTGRNGLLNMRQRTEEISGRFNLESASGEGTTITLAVNFPDE